MNRSLKLGISVVTGILLGCEGATVIDLNFDLDARALSFSPVKSTIVLAVADEPRSVGALNPFPRKNFEHGDVRITVSIDSLTLGWIVKNNSTVITRLGFNEAYCLDRNNQEKLKLNFRSFSVTDHGQKKSRIWTTQGAQSVEFYPGITSSVRMIPNNMRSTLNECLNTSIDSTATGDSGDLIGKEVSVSIPYERAGSSGKYILKIKITDTHSRTSYY